MPSNYPVSLVIQLPATTTKEGKWYISGCPALDIMSQGKTKAQAIKNLIEASSLFLISCFERGTLETVLKDCGFRPIIEPSKKRALPKNTFSIDVPLPFVIDDSDIQECHA